MERIRVLLVDDHEMVRTGLRAMLAVDPDLEVIGSEATGGRGLAQARDLRPNVMLLDARLPDMSGDEVCRHIQSEAQDVAVIMLTTFAEDDLVRRCIRAGARGYLLKDVEGLDLGRSIRAVVRGEAVVDPKVMPIVLAAARRSVDVDEERQPLNDRQRDVLDMVAQGLSNREIADRTHLSEHTIKGYVEEILERLGARNRVHAAILATKRGWI